MIKHPTWYLSINGVIAPTPTNGEIDEYDLDSSDTGRPESGYLVRDRKRCNLARYNLAWANLSAQDAWKLRTMLMPEQFTVTVLMFDQYITRTMYAGDRHWSQRFDSEGIAHISLQCQLSEV